MIKFIKEFWWFITAIIVLPFLFKIPAFISWMDFSIADSTANAINGFTTPVIGFTSVILLYKAFQKQSEANSQQKEIFDASLEVERQRITELEEKEQKALVNSYQTNLKIFKLISSQLIFQYEAAGKILKNFANLEKNKTLLINPLVHHISKEYSYFQKLDFVELYKSVSVLLSDKINNWEFEFMKTVGLIEFYNDLVVSFNKDIFDRHTLKYKELTEISGEIIKLIPKLAKSKYRNNITIEALNDILTSGENFREIKMTGTDFVRFNNEFLKPSLESLKYYSTSNFIDDEYEEICFLLSEMSKRLNQLEQTFYYYSLNYLEIYQKNFEGNNQLDEIKKFIDII